MSENAEKRDSGRDWKSVVEFVKDGLDLVEKIVGGRNALIAGAAGFALGVGVAATFVQPSDEACAEYVAQKNADRSREALIKFLKAPVRGGL